MTTGEQREDFENSESTIERPASHKSDGATAPNGAPSSSLARRGSGPRTAQGKERSKHNAVKHGIFSKVVLLPGESRAEFNSLLRGLLEHFQPVGKFEEGLVVMLAFTRWRERRLLIAEAAEIQAGIEFIEWDEKERQRAEVGNITTDENSGLIRNIANPEVLQRCLDRLAELQRRSKLNDFEPEKDEEVLRVLYRGSGNFHVFLDSYQLYSGAVDLEGSRQDDECRKNFLGELAKEIERLERYRDERASIESHRMKLQALRRNVPDSPRLDALLRYGAGLERTFDRTLSQLERAQRMRLGQPVAPRIDVNVSS